ncbi:hypothetical protein M378DRAFT_189519 [Amanita muscaria Koide BX008]|uniref:Uncharacterized protein n=1 Tax=Amanita muscaria (strain Koide BX008) TaxID=946122 RepID=A0A0C2X9B5_AMAMK|nr:hypothetical protein M378DRAFT_189519 [Amanita muscaria Koide BX008]
MLPTPDLSHLSSKDYELIYEPAEDTFLLLDALEKDAEALRATKPTVCLEIGSGSGCVTTFLNQILGSSVIYLATDVNLHACRCTCATASRNKTIVDCIHGSLACGLHHRLKDAVDIMTFNPPYVPTTSEEVLMAQEKRDIQGAWAGGVDGMDVTNHFLSVVKELLSPQGRFYLVALKANDIKAIRQKMLIENGLKSNIVLERKAGREHLFILSTR